MSQATDPVTVVVKRRLKPGHEADFETWLKGATEASMQIPGHLGVELIRPAKADGEYVLIFRYDSYQHLEAWEQSPARAEWLEKAKAFSVGEAGYEKYTGLEYWFTLPDQPSKVPPPPWKMALVTWVAIFPLSYLLGLYLGPHLLFLPPIGRTMVIAGILVGLMTYLIMPALTRLFARWLFPH